MSASKRMEALLKEHPNPLRPYPEDRYAGWYHAPNGQRYFGYGRVIEIGISHDGSRYVKVEPGNFWPRRKHVFFDPMTDEDMAKDLYPDINAREEDGGRKRFHTDNKNLQAGDIAPGHYLSPSESHYYGLGRVVAREMNDKGRLARYLVEPMRGGYQFWEIDSGNKILDEDLPRAPYSGSWETQARESKDRPRRKAVLPGLGWYGGLPDPNRINAPTQVKLGSEYAGAYFAPDGQWFVGVGKVVAVGVSTATNVSFTYVYVEPIPGKSGGDYSFFHPYTMEWMDELPSNPIPGVACTPTQRRALPSRWRNLPPIHGDPKPGDESHGRFCPPNAPRRSVYIGIGRTVRAGVDKGGRTWVEVQPFADKSDPKYQFFDPFTGKDMPDDYLPDE